MPRSLWNGTITFGVIAVPVKLYTATESKTVRFREVHLADEGKIEHRRFCSKEEEEVPYDEVVKGYEVREGEFVVLEKEEIEAAAGDRAKSSSSRPSSRPRRSTPCSTRRRTTSAPATRAPTRTGCCTTRSGRPSRAGLGRFTFHNREYLAAVRPLDGILALHTMRFADELVPGKDIDFDAPSRKPRGQGDRDGRQARRLAPRGVRPGKRKDTYREAVLDMIDRKAAGKKPRKAKEKPPEETPDLMAALEASLAGKK